MWHITVRKLPAGGWEARIVTHQAHELGVGADPWGAVGSLVCSNPQFFDVQRIKYDQYDTLTRDEVSRMSGDIVLAETKGPGYVRYQ